MMNIVARLTCSEIIQLTFYTIILSTGVAKCSNRSCCYKQLDLVNCEGSGLESLPSPNQSATGWCGGAKWENGGGDIRKISMKEMNISSFPNDILEKYPNTEELWLDYCQFSTLGKKQFNLPEVTSSMKVLSMRHNKIQDIHEEALSGLTSLTSLDLSHNKLVSIPQSSFSSLAKLEDLRLDWNQIAEVNTTLFEKLYNLKSLSIKSNLLYKWEKLSPSLYNLESISLRNNTLTYLSSDVFENPLSLRNLDLGENKLTTLDVNMFMNNHGLLYIDLSHNQIENLPRSIFYNLCELGNLDISYNQLKIAHYEWFVNMVYLASFSSGGRITEMSNSLTVGNPWNCDCNMESYATFLNATCQDNLLFMSGILEHINIGCNTGNLIKDADTSCKNIIQLCWANKTTKLYRNDRNGSCPIGNPMCPFLSDVCSGIKVSAPDAIHQIKNSTNETMKLTFIFVVIAVTLISVMVCFVYVGRRCCVKYNKSPSSSDSSSLQSLGQISTVAGLDIPRDTAYENTESNQLRPKLSEESEMTPFLVSPSSFSQLSSVSETTFDYPSPTSPNDVVFLTSTEDVATHSLNVQAENTVPKKLYDSNSERPKYLARGQTRARNIYENSGQLHFCTCHQHGCRNILNPGYSSFTAFLPLIVADNSSQGGAQWYVPLIQESEITLNQPGPQSNQNNAVYQHAYTSEHPMTNNNNDPNSKSKATKKRFPSITRLPFPPSIAKHSGCRRSQSKK